MLKDFINRKARQILRRIAKLCVKYNIKVQVHWISTKKNSLAEVLSRCQYTNIADRYSPMQIAKKQFGTLLKAGI